MVTGFSFSDFLTAGLIAVVSAVGGILFVLLKKNLSGLKNNQELSETLLNLKFVQEKYDEACLKLNAVENENKHLTAANASLKTELDSERAHLNNKIEELKKIKEEFTVQFKLISSEILKTQGADFSKIQQQNVAAAVEPLKTQLDAFKKYMQELDKTHIEDKTKIGEQIKNLMQMNQTLSSDAENLAKALKGNTKYQGDWGVRSSYNL